MKSAKICRNEKTNQKRNQALENRGKIVTTRVSVGLIMNAGVGNRFLAFGIPKGRLKIYWQTTTQEGTLKHNSYLMQTRFGLPSISAFVSQFSRNTEPIQPSLYASPRHPFNG